MISCEKATRFLSDAQERPLSLREKISLTMHTAICAACRRFGSQLQALRGYSRRFSGRDQREQD